MQITIETILAIFGGIACISAGISQIIKLFSPFKKLKGRVESLEQKKDNDYTRLGKIENKIDKMDDAEKIIMQSMAVLLNHEITGNGVEKLKEQREILENFLIFRDKDAGQ